MTNLLSRLKRDNDNHYPLNGITNFSLLRHPIHNDQSVYEIPQNS